jgi:hypothetical protein
MSTFRVITKVGSSVLLEADVTVEELKTTYPDWEIEVVSETPVAPKPAAKRKKASDAEA